MDGRIFLALAICSELIGTSALKASEGFTKFVPAAIVLGGYVSASYFLSLAMKTIPMGIIYALWSGIGIVVITLIGTFAFSQKIDFPALAGIALILLGVVVIHLFSKTAVLS